ncbi:MAG: hypothetical protein U0514_02720 [Candidatus Andersenbacteria bacterium]
MSKSTAQLKLGLAQVVQAEATLADLTPDADATTATLHDILTQMVAQARTAMEKGIEGNQTDNIGAIDESGAAVEQNWRPSSTSSLLRSTASRAASSQAPTQPTTRSRLRLRLDARPLVT